MTLAYFGKWILEQWDMYIIDICVCVSASSRVKRFGYMTIRMRPSSATDVRRWLFIFIYQHYTYWWVWSTLGIFLVQSIVYMFTYLFVYATHNPTDLSCQILCSGNMMTFRALLAWISARGDVYSVYRYIVSTDISYVSCLYIYIYTHHMYTHRHMCIYTFTHRLYIYIFIFITDAYIHRYTIYMYPFNITNNKPPTNGTFHGHLQGVSSGHGELWWTHS